MDWVASNEAVEVELHMELVSRCQRLTRMAHSVLHPLGLTMIFPFLPSLVSSFTIPKGSHCRVPAVLCLEVMHLKNTCGTSELRSHFPVVMVAMGHSSTWRPSLSVNEVALGCWSQFLCERGHKLQALPQLSVTPDWMRFSSATGVFLPSCGPLVYVTFVWSPRASCKQFWN
jgi:hypothetical protein